MLLAGNCHPYIVPILFGGRLISLDKKCGGVRPIVVGSTFRRLAAKCASYYAASKLAPILGPRQLGVGISGGCEAAIHSARRFLLSSQTDNVLVKLDFSNAFNCIRRDAMLQAVFDQIPELYRYCHLAYSSSSFLKFGSFTMLSEEGVQQGDPLGPLCFCLTVHPLLSSLRSLLAMGYLDDFSVGGPLHAVAGDVELIVREGAKLGLQLNVNKCEIICRHAPTSLPGILSQFTITNLASCTLLGAPLFTGDALDDALDNCCRMLSSAIVKLSSIASHDALILLRGCFSTPKVMHLLRCAPCTDHPSLSSFDNLLKAGVGKITNLELTDSQWLQASLPIREGGLGVRSVTSLATSAYLASAAGTLDLQNQILGAQRYEADPFVDSSIARWRSITNAEPLNQPLSSKQAAWDSHIIQTDKSRLHASFSDRLNLTRLAAVSAPHSGDWLRALPISACGLRLEDEAIRIAVGLRLGIDICIAHTCPCGEIADGRGVHALSCRKNGGWQSRHHALNDLIWRSLSAAGVPATKEPVGLLRSDGKRPDGLSLIPWREGKPVTWDVTVINSLADSYVSTNSLEPGAVAELAAARKRDKYSCLPPCYIFEPIAFESLGTINADAILFLKDIGRRLSQTSGDRRASEFLFQRLSITVQRFNAVVFKGCFSAVPDLD